jgi:hypothetical protein
MADFTIRQDDTLPNLVATLKNAAGTGIDLSTGVTGVKFIMNNIASGTNKVNAACTITTPASGIVTYEWLAADTDTAGAFRGEFQITYTSGKILTCPNATYVTIDVIADLGD